MNIDMSLLLAVQKSASEETLRDICISLLEKGVSSDDLLEQFELLRSTYNFQEDYEDIILNVMDALSGWCSPSRSLIHLTAA